MVPGGGSDCRFVLILKKLLKILDALNFQNAGNAVLEYATGTLQIRSLFLPKMDLLEPFEVQFLFRLELQKSCGKELVLFSIRCGCNIDIGMTPRQVNSH